MRRQIPLRVVSHVLFHKIQTGHRDFSGHSTPFFIQNQLIGLLIVSNHIQPKLGEPINIVLGQIFLHPNGRITLFEAFLELGLIGVQCWSQCSGNLIRFNVVIILGMGKQVVQDCVLSQYSAVSIQNTPPIIERERLIAGKLSFSLKMIGIDQLDVEQLTQHGKGQQA